MTRFLLAILLIMLLSAIAEFMLPWWSVAVVAFAVSLLVRQNAGRAFFMGFMGVGLFWLVAALLRDITNDHILASRMAMLFKLPGSTAFIFVTAIIGGLVGGLSSWAAALIRPSD